MQGCHGVRPILMSYLTPPRTDPFLRAVPSLLRATWAGTRVWSCLPEHQSATAAPDASWGCSPAGSMLGVCAAAVQPSTDLL